MSDIATSESLHGAARASRGASAQKIVVAASSDPSDSSGFWWRLAGVAWVAAVLSFVWGRYDLPFSGEAWAAARERVSSADWMLILAAILAPLVLLWALASLLRGSRRLSAEARSVAEAARAVSARGSAQQDDEAWRAAALMGEVQGAGPTHIRREVERATHAIGALHQQMKSIEEALASQSAALDDVAERAEARAKTIAESLRIEREALQGLVASIEADGGRAMNLVAMRPGDMEKTQRTLDALKSQSDAIERTVEAAGVRLNAIAAEIQQALRQAKPGDAQSLTEGARASVREAANHAIGAIGETEAVTRARLFEGEAAEAPPPVETGEVVALPDDEAAELRRRNLAGLRRQMDRLRQGEEEAQAAAAEPAFLQTQSQQSAPQPGQGLAARLAGGASAAGTGLAAGAAASAAAAVAQARQAAESLAVKTSGAGEALAEGAADQAAEVRAGASAKLSRLAQAFGETAEEAEREVKALDERAGEAVRIDLSDVDLSGADFLPAPGAAGEAGPKFSGLASPPLGAEQPVSTWDVLGDFDASMVESEPLDRDAAALAAQAAPEVPSSRIDFDPPPVFTVQNFAPQSAEPEPTPDPGPAPLFGDPTPPRAMSFDLERLAPLADLNIPSPLLSGVGATPLAGAGGRKDPAPQAEAEAAPAAPAPVAAAPVQAPPAQTPTPLFPPIGTLGAGEGGGEAAARGWLGAASGEAAGGLDSFGERREVEAAPAPASPPRPAIVWRQPEAPMFGGRGAPRPKPLDWEKVALGLNFPVSEEDTEAEEALYEVSIDHQIGALIQASEDMLAALVDLRLYMEDHQPRIAPPEVWRDWLDGRVSVESQPVVEIGPQEALNRVRDLIDHDPAVERLAVSFAGRFEDLVRRALDESEDPGVVTRLLDTRTGRAYAMVACAGGRVD